MLFFKKNVGVGICPLLNQTESWRVLKFTQWHNQEIRTSVMLHCIVDWVVPDVMRIMLPLCLRIQGVW